MNPKNSKKSPIHENADANITCDFGDGDISRSRSFLSTTGLNHATHKHPTHKHLTNPHATNINNPLNPSGVGLVNFFVVRASLVSIRACVPNLGAVRRSCRKKARLNLQVDRQFHLPRLASVYSAANAYQQMFS